MNVNFSKYSRFFIIVGLFCGVNFIGAIQLHEVTQKNVHVLTSSDLDTFVAEMKAQSVWYSIIGNASSDVKKKIVACITKENIEKISPDMMYWLVHADKGLAQEIAARITKENIEKIPLYIIYFLVCEDEGLAQKIAACITKENIEKKIPSDMINMINGLAKVDKGLAKVFAAYITKENIEKIPSDIINGLW